ncbi:hypothetical protein BC833DRAFT_593716 [Globomyces pollinis-pini]|nr:hypothetical protein BC833DRAFT_593716 [Globomyces pollinis-pini]
MQQFNDLSSKLSNVGLLHQKRIQRSKESKHQSHSRNSSVSNPIIFDLTETPSSSLSTDTALFLATLFKPVASSSSSSILKPTPTLSNLHLDLANVAQKVSKLPKKVSFSDTVLVYPHPQNTTSASDDDVSQVSDISLDSNNETWTSSPTISSQPASPSPPSPRVTSQSASPLPLFYSSSIAKKHNSWNGSDFSLDAINQSSSTNQKPFTNHSESHLQTPKQPDNRSPLNSTNHSVQSAKQSLGDNQRLSLTNNRFAQRTSSLLKSYQQTGKFPQEKPRPKSEFFIHSDLPLYFSSFSDLSTVDTATPITSTMNTSDTAIHSSSNSDRPLKSLTNTTTNSPINANMNSSLNTLTNSSYNNISKTNNHNNLTNTDSSLNNFMNSNNSVNTLTISPLNNIIPTNNSHSLSNTHNLINTHRKHIPQPITPITDHTHFSPPTPPLRNPTPFRADSDPTPVVVSEPPQCETVLTSVTQLQPISIQYSSFY